VHLAGGLAPKRQSSARALRQINNALVANGVDLRRCAASLLALPSFVHDWRGYRAQARARGEEAPAGANLWPILADRVEPGGTASGHYFHQDLWAARRVFSASPRAHLDVGSRVDGFVAHLLTFRAVTVVDIRPLGSTVPGLTFVQADATSLDGIPDGTYPSVSSLHVIEHVGLGRYGDQLHPDGWRDALSALQRVLAPAGRLYLGVPIGAERVMFNAHRIFAPQTVITAVSDCDLVEFSAVDDRGEFVPDADPRDFDEADYSCGLFEFQRRA
jgi:SAM-dependent methyltransferase